MASSSYGRKLNPHRTFREPRGIKANRMSCITLNDPATITAGQTLRVSIPTLDSDSVIVPGTMRLAFNITLNSKDPNRTVCNNLGRAIVERLKLRAGNTEILLVDDYNIFGTYRDLWKSPTERSNDQYQGIDTSENRNVTKLRLGADDADNTIKKDKAISDVYGNRFCIPLDHEILESHMPFYQSGLSDRLTYEITFAPHNKVIQAEDDPAASYEINNISLEYDKVIDSNLADTIRLQYKHGAQILCERITRKSMAKVKKNDTVLQSIKITEHSKSLQGILLLFQEPPTSYAYASETFYNPQIEKLEIAINGIALQLYDHGLEPRHQWDEVRKFFGAGPGKRHPESSRVLKDLQLADVSLGEFLTDKFAVWLDLRTSDDDLQHGTGRPIGNDEGSGISIEIRKKITGSGDIDMYVYIVQDAQLVISDGRFQKLTY